MDEPVVLRLEPSSDRYDATDDRWLDQVAGFITELQAEVGTVTLDREPVAGTKGALDSILVSMTSAGVLTASVELLKGWLTRDRSRSVKVTWSSGGEVQAIELAGSENDAAIDAIVSAVSKQLPAST